jgi:hypothetical protein
VVDLVLVPAAPRDLDDDVEFHGHQMRAADTPAFRPEAKPPLPPFIGTPGNVRAWQYGFPCNRSAMWRAVTPLVTESRCR